MKVKIEFRESKPYAVANDGTVVGEINSDVKVTEGEEVDIYFKCAKRNACGYPFCGSSCEGNSGFYVAGREERGY